MFIACRSSFGRRPICIIILSLSFSRRLLLACTNNRVSHRTQNFVEGGLLIWSPMGIPIEFPGKKASYWTLVALDRELNLTSKHPGLQAAYAQQDKPVWTVLTAKSWCTAESTALSDSDLRQLSSGVIGRLFGAEPSSLVGLLEGQLATTRSLDIAIDTVRLSPALTGEDQTKLDGLARLYQLSSHSIPLLAFCLAQPTLADMLGKAATFSTRSFAERIITITADGPGAPSQSTWTSFCHRLFTEETMAVLLGLIRSGIIPVLPPVCKDYVLSVLRTAGETISFDIGRQSIRKLFPNIDDPDDESNLSTIVGVPHEQRSAVTTYICKLQRLQALVNEPVDVGALMQCGYVSAEDIARRGARSVPCIVDQGVPRERADRICNQARFIASRNEHLATRALTLRGTGSRMDVAVAAIESLSTSSTDSSKREEINLSTMFGLGSMGCEECASLTGPAAFFVDLLHKLSGIHPENSGSLLQKLLERRPDLGKLELSCANTNTLVPYVDLVNEVLESVVWNLERSGEPLIPPFDSSDHDTDEGNLMQPHNTNFDVYSQILQPVVSPLHTFPYNQAVQSSRAYLSSLAVSRSRLLLTFRSPYSITTDEGLVADINRTLDHALSAEILNLQHEDYVAIAKEGFYPIQLVGDLRGTPVSPDEYEQMIGLKKPSSQYWGFPTDEDMAPRDPTVDKGLAKIQDELLPRSGLTFQDLLSIVQTKYVGGQLAIEIKKKPDGKDPEPSELLIYMRLRQWNDATQQIQPLEAPTCDRLQAFLRLHSKLQWPMEELDAVTMTFVTDRELMFTPAVLDQLATVKRLADLTRRSPSELQPFWGDINTHGSNSLYNQLFGTAVLPKEIRKALALGNDGHVVQAQSQGMDDVDGLLATVLMALKLTTDEFDSIRVALRLSPPVKLTLTNVSAFYRVSLLCRILNIPPQAYSQLLMLYSENFNPFLDPCTTLALVEGYLPQLPTMSHWTLDRLLFVIKKAPSATDEACRTTVDQQITIVESVRSSLNDYTLQGSKKRMDGENALVSLLDEIIIDAEARQKIIQFIHRTDKVPIGSDEAKYFIGQLSTVIGNTAATDLCQKIIDASPGEGRLEVFLEAFLSARYREQQCQAVLKSLTPFFPGLSMALLRFSLEKLVQLETNPQLSGMDALINLCNPDKQTEDSLSAYFRPPTTDVYQILSAADEEPKELVLDEAQLKFREQTDDRQPRWAATTQPLTGGRWYHLYYKGKADDLSWRAGEASQATVSLIAVVVVDLMRISLLVDQFRLHAAEVEFGSIIQFVTRSRQQLQRIKFTDLSLREIKVLEDYLQLRDSFSRNGATLPLLALYKWLFSFSQERNESPDKIRQALVQNLAHASGWNQGLCTEYLQSRYPQYDGARLVQLFRDVAVLQQMHEAILFVRDLGLPSLSLASLFDMARPAWSDLVQADFTNAAALRVAIQSRRFPTPSNGGRTALADASDSIRNSQRAALIHYLLATPYAEKNGLREADQLFGHFLIDVQMGAGLRTSRIKQAISSVQLFAQRCALGVEVHVGSKVLDRVDLEYMLRYRLWEADRKAYLYPENWADPTLRDNKTEQFQALESRVMHAKLDRENIASLVKDYVHGINEIANLRVECYVIERKKNPDNDYFHFFACTRTSPPVFYYRNTVISMDPALPYTPTWSSWTRVNLDVPVQETGADGKQLARPGSYIIPAVQRGRLYAFLPEIIASQKDNAAVSEKTFSELFSGEGTTKISQAHPERF
ncbi:hypothetical protein EYZ11_010775 [Aspergillus tanneri]|uniref:Uncharacterized protein n=1 Tax=Aspergillus tanneri TaxID=1220188 RepID=A0A4S3J6M6_9EURO|nr:hypothetical protein EYZ11_010775 [Aspergillus tanneri]